MSDLEDIKKWLESIEEEPLEEMAGFFSARIGDYENHMSHWKALYEWMGKLVPPQAETLLDLGCGTGLELDEIFRYHPDIQVTGIDLSEEMLHMLWKKHPDKKMKLVAGDYFKEPFGTACFDVVVSFETLHHFTAEKKLGVFTKIYQCLKAGGCYLQVDYVADDEDWEDFLFAECERRRKKWKIPDNQFVHFDTPLTLEHELKLLRKAGFSQVKVLGEIDDTGNKMMFVYYSCLSGEQTIFEFVMYNICFLSYTMYIKRNKKEGVCMLALQGYYDGNSVQTLEKIQAKKNQKLVITILDEFIEETPENKIYSARGSLAEYANPELLKEEDSAWEKAVVEEYENA